MNICFFHYNPSNNGMHVDILESLEPLEDVKCFLMEQRYAIVSSVSGKYYSIEDRQRYHISGSRDALMKVDANCRIMEKLLHLFLNGCAFPLKFFVILDIALSSNIKFSDYINPNSALVLEKLQEITNRAKYLSEGEDFTGDCYFFLDDGSFKQSFIDPYSSEFNVFFRDIHSKLGSSSSSTRGSVTSENIFDELIYSRSVTDDEYNYYTGNSSVANCTGYELFCYDKHFTCNRIKLSNLVCNKITALIDRGKRINYQENDILSAFLAGELLSVNLSIVLESLLGRSVFEDRGYALENLIMELSNIKLQATIYNTEYVALCTTDESRNKLSHLLADKNAKDILNGRKQGGCHILTNDCCL